MLALVWRGDVESLEDLHRRFGATIDWAKTCSLDAIDTVWSKTVGSCNALHLACLGGSIERLKFLVYNTSLNDVRSRSGRGYTCAHFAAQLEHNGNDILEYLKTCGADMNAQSQDGKSPLHMAVEANSKGNVWTLLRLGVMMKTDSKGFTPVAKAFVDRHMEIVDIFNKHDASFASENIHASLDGVAGYALLPALRDSITRKDLEACR